MEIALRSSKAITLITSIVLIGLMKAP